MRIHYQTQAGPQIREASLEELGAAFDDIQRQLVAEGQVAVGIEVGGTLFDPGSGTLADHLRGAGDRVQDLRVVAQSIDSLARSTAESALEYTTRFLEQVPALADALYAGEPVEPRRLSDLFEGLTWLAEYLRVGLPLVSGSGPDLDEVQRRFRAALLHLAELDDTLDTLFLANVLAYEIVPAVEAVRQVVGRSIGGDAP